MVVLQVFGGTRRAAPMYEEEKRLLYTIVERLLLLCLVYELCFSQDWTSFSRSNFGSSGSVMTRGKSTIQGQPLIVIFIA
jgi:hypothetical protein